MNEEEKALIRLVDELPDPVAIHAAGVMQHANPTLCALLGRDYDDLVGVPVIELVHPDDRALVAERVRHAYATGEALPITEERFVHADGRVVTVEVKGIHVRFHGAQAMMAVGRDVTERRWLEERLRRADRLASLGTLAAGVAHEINNPLTYVLGGLDVAIAQLESPNELDRSRILRRLARVRTGATRIAGIVSDLRVFTRPTEDHDQLVDLSTVVAEAVELTRGQVQSRAVFSQQVGWAPPVVGSHRRLVQVLVNLIVNAVQAIPEDDTGQEVTVRLRSLPSGDAVLEVQDTGVGISESDITRIFEPYVTTKTGEGTGLGLWISHEIVSGLGGNILVNSERGCGTTMTVVLPQAPTQLRQVVPLAQAVRVPSVGRKVVVIDDEPLVGQMVADLLAGHHVDVYLDGALALRALLDAPLPDVIFCDVVMPGLSGREVYQILAQQCPGAEERVVFITAGAYSAADRAFLGRIANPVLPKPFRLEQLEHALIQVGQERSQ